MPIIDLIAKLAAKMPYTVQKARYFKHFHKWPNLKQPVGEMPDFGHYVASRTVENRANRRWGLMADKYAVRQEIDRILGPGHLIPLLGVWERGEDIDFDALPDSFILKTNNGCGTNIFVHDKKSIDREDIVRRLNHDLRYPYPQLTGQLHYSLIPPRIVAEEIMLQDGEAKSLTDYKIHCVNGEPITMYVFSDRDEVDHFKFTMKAYTADWRALPPSKTPDDVRADAEAPGRPEWLDEMLDMARKLSVGEEYVRIDFYHTDGKILFGEMTFSPDTIFHSCYAPYQPAMKYLLAKIAAARPATSG